jgi:hypothetical protein
LVRTRIAFILAGVCLLSAVATAGDSPAVKYLSATLANTDNALAAMESLASTKDKDLLPVFAAMARSEDKQHRLFAVARSRDAFGEDAAGLLKERFKTDPVMAIRAEALVQLIELKVVTDDELLEAMKADDEGLRIVACRALVARNRTDVSVMETLRKLTSAKDDSTIVVARMCLLKAGQADQHDPLMELAKKESTSRLLLSLMLGQIIEEKIAPAADIAQYLAANRTGPLQVQAYKAVSATTPNAPELILAAIRKTDSIVSRIYLLHVLADRDDATDALKAVAATDDAAGALARFDLARREGSGITETGLKALESGHPVVCEYVLDRAKKELDARGPQSEAYVPVLVKLVTSVDPSLLNMSEDHIRAARAVTLLVDYGSPQAMEAVRSILSGKYSAITRAAAAGLLRSQNHAACELARPLLKSPYEEIMTDAMLVLGRFGDSEALPSLEHILHSVKGEPVPLATLVCWYTLKTQRQSASAAKELARGIH